MSSHRRRTPPPTSHRRPRRHAARLAAGAAALAVLAGAGVAYAAWTASGTGTAGAKATTFQPLTVSAGATTALLYPGGSADAVVSITNPNPFPVKITQIGQDTTPGKYVSSDQGASCTDASGSTHPTGVTLTTATGTPLASVPANSSAPVTLTGKVTMSAASDNGCQGATFAIPVTVTATS
jgi:hypothetical protein